MIDSRVVVQKWDPVLAVWTAVASLQASWLFDMVGRESAHGGDEIVLSTSNGIISVSPDGARASAWLPQGLLAQSLAIDAAGQLHAIGVPTPGVTRYFRQGENDLVLIDTGTPATNLRRAGNEVVAFSAAAGDGHQPRIQFDSGVGVILRADSLAVSRSTDGGATWTASLSGLAISFAAIGATQFASVLGSGILASNDGGATWKSVLDNRGEGWRLAAAGSFIVAVQGGTSIWLDF